MMFCEPKDLILFTAGTTILPETDRPLKSLSNQEAVNSSLHKIFPTMLFKQLEEMVKVLIDKTNL